MFKKIVIVSDSHQQNDYLRYALGQEQPFDILIHAGDVEGDIDLILPPDKRDYDIVCVRGNCDRGAWYPRAVSLSIDGDVWSRSIYICHGDQYKVKLNDSLLLAAARKECADVVIYGHTHIANCYETEDGILVINPGSVALPAPPEYRHSYAVLQIDEDGFMEAAIKYLPEHISW